MFQIVKRWARGAYRRWVCSIIGYPLHQCPDRLPVKAHTGGCPTQWHSSYLWYTQECFTTITLNTHWLYNGWSLQQKHQSTRTKTDWIRSNLGWSQVRNRTCISATEYAQAPVHGALYVSFCWTLFIAFSCIMQYTSHSLGEVKDRVGLKKNLVM